MSASIVISGLHWAAPDGTAVLHDLDLTFLRERTGIVGRNGVGKSTLLRLIAGELQPGSGRIAVTGTAATLRQIMTTRDGETIADLFGVSANLAVLDGAEAGTASFDELADADWTLPARLATALASVGLEVNAATPLAALSGGQRTRAALAAAIFARPEFLLLDEPTNHLDPAGREAVHAVLDSWRGGALVVSHDRELLERMDAVVEVTALGAVRYGGNWSAYQARKAVELDAAEQGLAIAERDSREVACRTQRMAERKQRRDAAGAREGAKGGTPRILLGARRNRAEGSGGDARRLAERQKNETAEALAKARAKVEVLEPLTVSIPRSALPAEKTVLAMDGVTAGYRAGKPALHDVSLTIVGPERIAVTGPNGSGKSTLLALASGLLEPLRGTIRRPLAAAMLDQHLRMFDPSASVAQNFVRLNPDADANACRAALARFRFRGETALQAVASLSGGEALRAALACRLGAGAPPQFLILDEPSNHLDLDSLAAVEAALRGYDGALLVTSHDRMFLDAIGITRLVELAAP